MGSGWGEAYSRLAEINREKESPTERQSATMGKTIDAWNEVNDDKVVFWVPRPNIVIISGECSSKKLLMAYMDRQMVIGIKRLYCALEEKEE